MPKWRGEWVTFPKDQSKSPLQEDAENGGRQRRSASDGSTWRGLWRKLAVLLPYLWPKKSLLLQLNVILCFLLLAGVRVANVFVPLYSKHIGQSDTEVFQYSSPGSHIKYPHNTCA